MTQQLFFSIVSPVYKAEGIVAELVKQISDAVTKITPHYEIILIEDHSPDNSWKEIVQEAQTHQYVKSIRLSRNYGQHAAITAGLELAKGDYVVVLDCDLQHNPAYIAKLYELIQQGNDLVFTRFKTRKHNFFKNLLARSYYKFVKFFSGYDIDPNIGSFSILSRKVVDAFNQYHDHKKIYLWVLNWLGFKSDILEIDHNQRYHGTSTYNAWRLLSLALNVILVNSNRPLYLTVCFGLAISSLSFLGILSVLYQYFVKGSLLGWSSTIVFIMFFSGLILTSIGISALYIAKIFEQTKQRPRYVIAETLNIP